MVNSLSVARVLAVVIHPTLITAQLRGLSNRFERFAAMSTFCFYFLVAPPFPDTVVSFSIPLLSFRFQVFRLFALTRFAEDCAFANSGDLTAAKTQTLFVVPQRFDEIRPFPWGRTPITLGRFQVVNIVCNHHLHYPTQKCFPTCRDNDINLNFTNVVDEIFSLLMWTPAPIREAAR